MNANIHTYSIESTGVDLSKILGSKQNIGGKGGNNWWNHKRFSTFFGGDVLHVAAPRVSKQCKEYKMQQLF